MTKTGHNLTGIALGLILFSITDQTFHYGKLFSALSAYAAYKGSNAPDFLEIAWFDKEKLRRRSVIRHRTYTHWLLLWVLALLICTYGFLTSDKNWWIGLCFTFGGLLHLAMDYPNPSGIPIIYPTRRLKSLKWWKSGENEGWIALLFFSIAFTVLYFQYRVKIERVMANPVAEIHSFGQSIVSETSRFFQVGIEFVKGWVI